MVLSFLPVLAPCATIYPITVAVGDFRVPQMSLARKGVSVQGILVPSRGVHVKMLRFAAIHGIKPITQEFPLTAEGIDEAMAKLDKGEVRYRAVFAAER